MPCQMHAEVTGRKELTGASDQISQLVVDPRLYLEVGKYVNSLCTE